MVSNVFYLLSTEPSDSKSVLSQVAAQKDETDRKFAILEDQLKKIATDQQTFEAKVVETAQRQDADIDSQYKWLVHGHEVQPRSQVSDVGKWAGVAAMSKWPTRALTHDWDPCMHATGRIVATTSYIAHTWVSGVTIYGTPVGPTHPGARETTEALIFAATRLVVQAVGCRFVAGDFNCNHDASPAIAQLRNLGFQDIQDLWFQQSGCLPRPTCRGKTRRDFVFVSQELAARFVACFVNDQIWPDHAVVCGSFKAGSGSNLRSIWPIPQPLDWSVLPPSHVGEAVSFEHCSDCTAQYTNLWQNRESAVVEAAKHRGKEISQLSLGRAVQTAPRRSNADCPPVKVGRVGDCQPSYLGFNMTHLKWFKQLRRLHSYVRLVEQPCSSPTQTEHRSLLWKSICSASGFAPNFPVWWESRTQCVGEVCSIPSCPPQHAVASLIFQAFEWEVRDFEKSLTKHRSYERKLRNASVNHLFRQVKRD